VVAAAAAGVGGALPGVLQASSSSEDEVPVDLDPTILTAVKKALVGTSGCMCVCVCVCVYVCMCVCVYWCVNVCGTVSLR